MINTKKMQDKYQHKVKKQAIFFIESSQKPAGQLF